MTEATIDKVLEIAEYWYKETKEDQRTDWTLQAYIDELSSWAQKLIDNEYKDMKGEL
jgi:hypothetical protein